MTDLRPLFESSPNPKTRELLRAGLGERPPFRAMERTATALGVGVALSASTASATALGSATVSAAGASAIGTLTIVKWLAVGALSGTLVAGGATVVQRSFDGAGKGAPESAPPAAQEPAPGAHGGLAPRASETNAATPASPYGAASGTARPTAAQDAARWSPTHTPDPREATGSPALEDGAATEARSGPLSIELERVDRARAFLAVGNAVQALSELSEYEKIRSTGTLDREAWILRIDALLRVGKRNEARELARGYLARFPKDAHAARLRELAGGS